MPCSAEMRLPFTIFLIIIVIFTKIIFITVIFTTLNIIICPVLSWWNRHHQVQILQRLTKPSWWSAQWIGTQTQGKQWHCWWLWHWWYWWHWSYWWNWWFIFIILRNCRWNLDYEVSHDRPILWLFSILRCDGWPLQICLKTIFMKIIIIIMVAFYI